MGGTIALLAEQGHDVLLVDMTDGSPTPRGDRASRLVEAEAALRELQPSPEGAARGGRVRRVLLDLKNREVEHTIEARHKVAGVYRAHQAQVIFAPHPEDAHPDHLAVHKIAWDARFDAKLTKVDMPTPPGFSGIGPPIYPRWFFFYYCSHLRRPIDPTFVIDTSTTHARKLRSIAAYQTQFGPAAGRPDFDQVFSAYNGYCGWLVGTRYGEPFTSKEPLGLGGLSSVLGLG